MCITVAYHDLGPADVVLDLDERLLVLRPTLAHHERRKASRRAFERAGVRQLSVGPPRCVCGATLDLLDDIADPAMSRLASLACGVVGLLVISFGVGASTASPAVASGVFSGDWLTVEQALAMTCETTREHRATCVDSPFGTVTVAAWPRKHSTMYTVAGGMLAGCAYVVTFDDGRTLDKFTDGHVGERVDAGLAFGGSRTFERILRDRL